LRNSVVPQYTAPRALVKEILRCKKVQPNNIKFASLNGCILTIATDDKETHRELTKEWCQDAFTAGTIFATPRREQQSTIVIKGFPPQAELEKEDIEDLNQQGILDPIRIYNKKLQQNTTLLKAKTSNQKSLEDALKHGVKIGFTIYRVEHEKKVHQCFKCQKFGHSASECRNQVQVPQPQRLHIRQSQVRKLQWQPPSILQELSIHQRPKSSPETTPTTKANNTTK